MMILAPIKKIAISTIAMLSACFACGSLSAQRLDSLVNMYNTQYPVERVHLQFDKSSYSPQDYVWFKAYLLSGISPDNMLSKSLYVDFSDEKGRVLAHNVYPITDGYSFGQFKVPDSIQGNLLHVRAYTKWMLNFDSAFLYDKNLTIIQPISKRIKGKMPTPDPVLYFFPEGGDAVAGLKTRMAFMCEDQYGQPENITGDVVETSDGSEVAKLIVQHDGMGSFYFTPVDGKKYTATWKDDKGVPHTTVLPEIQSTGITLSVHASDASKTFVVQRQDNAADNFKSLHIVATLYQEVVYLANISLTAQTSATGEIPISNLPSGILQITVFDNNWTPLAERICYVKSNSDIFEAETGFSKLNFNPRGQNEVVIDVPDSIPANLSISVTDAALASDSSNNLVSNMFLTSQIKGNIYKPFYYFSDTTEQIDSALDLVMLTHGWRRFDWKKIIDKQPLDIQYPMDTSFLSFSGKIFGATPAQLTAAGTMLAFIRGKVDTTQRLDFVPLNPDGTFNDPNAVFFDSLTVYYKFAGKKDYLTNSVVNFMPNRMISPGRIPIDPNDIIRARDYDTTGLSASESLFDQYWATAHPDTAGSLKAVEVVTKAKTKEEKLDDQYTSGLFKGGDAKIFDIEDDPAAASQLNVLSYLQGRVAGLQISNPDSQSPSLSWRGSTPALYLDEMPLSDPSIILSMNMSDVAMVKVFPPPFMGAFGGGEGGAIAVYTKRGSDVANNNDDRPQVPHKSIIAYSEIREFYSPDYLSLAGNNDNNSVDTRQTLYWNPLVITTAQNNEVKLPFFNNDITHSFRIVLEGMNSAGQLVHIEKVVQ